jgi:hypothetical protein
MTTTVSHAENLKSGFVMMNDSNDRHDGNKLWGERWSLSCFPSKTTSTGYKANGDAVICRVRCPR